MGRYLYEKGHRRVAFISPYHGVGWSQDRLVGLRDGMRAAGIRRVVGSRHAGRDTWRPGPA